MREAFAKQKELQVVEEKRDKQISVFLCLTTVRIVLNKRYAY